MVLTTSDICFTSWSCLIGSSVCSYSLHVFGSRLILQVLDFRLQLLLFPLAVSELVLWLRLVLETFGAFSSHIFSSNRCFDNLALDECLPAYIRSGGNTSKVWWAVNLASSANAGLAIKAKLKRAVAHENAPDVWNLCPVKLECTFILFPPFPKSYYSAILDLSRK